MSDSFMTPWTIPARLLCPWDFPGKNTRVGCHFLLQGIFPTQALSSRLLPCLLDCRQILYHWTEKWTWRCLSCLTLCDPMDCTVCGILQARILEWVAFPFSRGSSQHRDRTQVSQIAGRFSTSWATRESLYHWASGESCKLVDSPQS